MSVINTKKQAGFNLIENLVALLVLSIGLLGVAAMMVNGIRFTDSAAIHSQAVFLAYDLVEKIRANQNNADDYAIAIGATITLPPDCVAGACTPTQVAQADLDDWKTKLVASLPSGDGSAVVAATQATITIQWNERGQARSYNLVMGL